MKTKFVYIFALIMLGMSSFAVARTHAKHYGNKQNHYRQSSPHEGFSSDQQSPCDKAKLELEGVPRQDSECKAKGEFGLPQDIVHDSECNCRAIDEISPPQGAPDMVCTFGVSWACSFDND